jgi:hypothetical protein
MPTASPSMSASRGVVEETDAKAVAAKIAAIETPTPSTAVSSGMPATTNERNVTISTSSAITRPMPSVIEIAGIDIEKRSPPITACAPWGSSFSRSLTAVRSVSLVAAETSEAWPSNCSRTIAAEWSSETMPVTCSSYGLVAARTPWTFPRSVTVRSIGVL